MIEKIKNFLDNKVTKIVELVLVVLTSAGLIVGGITVDQIDKAVGLTSGIITAVGALALFIASLVNKKE